eukprot:2567148-Pleurochrysis_carterae.AAC.1
MASMGPLPLLLGAAAMATTGALRAAIGVRRAIHPIRAARAARPALLQLALAADSDLFERSHGQVQSATCYAYTIRLLLCCVALCAARTVSALATDNQAQKIATGDCKIAELLCFAAK